MGYSVIDSYARDPVHVCVEFYWVERVSFWVVFGILGWSNMGQDEQGGLT